MKKFIILIVVILIIVVGFFAYNQFNKLKEEIANEKDGQKTEEEKSVFTLEQVAEHNSTDDCWLVIDNKVYNVTDFIPQHPGRQAILGGCGKDATTLFETRPMGSGTPHSDRAKSLREDYYIGDLK